MESRGLRRQGRLDSLNWLDRSHRKPTKVGIIEKPCFIGSYENSKVKNCRVNGYVEVVLDLNESAPYTMYRKKSTGGNRW